MPLHMATPLSSPVRSIVEKEETQSVRDSECETIRPEGGRYGSYREGESDLPLSCQISRR